MFKLYNIEGNAVNSYRSAITFLLF